MTCTGFEKYSTGEWSTEQFEKHVNQCDACRKAVEQDRELYNLSRSLKKQVDAPFLWSRIENSLQQEKSVLRSSDNYKSWFVRIAAVLVLAIGMSSIYLMQRRPPDSGLLAESALQKVERQEQQYEAAISELEVIVAPRLAQMDQELTLLYRDRLETIDTQIMQCKEALAVNPANAHIRSYLLTALRDKKETLKEIMAYQIS